MLKQVQTQKQQHTILPQQIELLNLFHLNTLELELRIQDELNENPALEELASGDEANGDKCSKETVQDFQNWEEYAYDDIPDYKTEYKNYLSTEKIPERPMAESTDFREELKKQCRFLAWTPGIERAALPKFYPQDMEHRRISFSYLPPFPIISSDPRALDSFPARPDSKKISRPAQHDSYIS